MEREVITAVNTGMAESSSFLEKQKQGVLQSFFCIFDRLELADTTVLTGGSIGTL